MRDPYSAHQSVGVRHNPADLSLIQLSDSRPLYRFVREQAHADALVAGRIWISTLGTCRAYEDRERGDDGEGTLTYRISRLAGDGTDPQSVRRAEQAGIHVGPGAESIRLVNVSGTTALSDAWLLCMTHECHPDMVETFGRFCVRIDHPRSLFVRICEELVRENVARVRGVAGPVIYCDRSYRDDEVAPGHIALVKPERYRQQREVRMVWWRHDHNPVSSQLVFVPPSVAKAVQVL